VTVAVRAVAIAAWAWTTLARHELAHALAAWAVGGTVRSIRLLPGYSSELGAYFGYVRWEGEPHWAIDAAPYAVAAVWFAVTLAVLRGTRPGPRARRVLAWFGPASAYVDIAWGYLRGLVRPEADVAELLSTAPEVAVHALFLTALLLGGLGLRAIRSSLREPFLRRGEPVGPGGS